jgi:hypothetical protein
MAIAELKTRQTDANVEEFLNSVQDDERRSDGFRLLEMFKRVTGEEPKMWGPAIVGFGKTPLKYASGRELDWPVTAFSPRKASLSLYLTCDISEYRQLLKKLGKHKTGVGCLYIKRLSEIDEAVLEDLIRMAHDLSQQAK